MARRVARFFNPPRFPPTRFRWELVYIFDHDVARAVEWSKFRQLTWGVRSIND